MILRTNYNLREQIRNHFLGDAKTHLDVTKADIAAYQMVPDLQVTNVAQPVRITCNVIASHRIGIKEIGLGAGKTKEAQHILGMQ